MSLQLEFFKDPPTHYTDTLSVLWNQMFDLEVTVDIYKYASCKFIYESVQNAVFLACKDIQKRYAFGMYNEELGYRVQGCIIGNFDFSPRRNKNNWVYDSEIAGGFVRVVLVPHAARDFRFKGFPRHMPTEIASMCSRFIHAFAKKIREDGK